MDGYVQLACLSPHDHKSDDNTNNLVVFRSRSAAHKLRPCGYVLRPAVFSGIGLNVIGLDG